MRGQAVRILYSAHGFAMYPIYGLTVVRPSPYSGNQEELLMPLNMLAAIRADPRRSLYDGNQRDYLPEG